MPSIMASPEVAVSYFPAKSSVSTFDKYSAHRPSKLRNAHISSVATALPEIDWSPSYPAAADVGSISSVEGNSALSLPVIDLDGLRSGDPAARAKIVRKIGKATEAWGFFQIVNHSVTDELVDRMQEQARQFFNLPLDVKKQVENLGPNKRCLGYKETFAGSIRDRKIPIKESLADFRSHTSTVANLAAKLWTNGNPAFSKTIHEHCDSVEMLGLQLLELLAESLGLQRTFFSRHFQTDANCIGTWRLHHFPPNEAPLDVWRTVPHSDPSVLTILKQDVGGLQVKKPGSRIWIDVKPLPGSFVVNVGDILEAWSNGRFPSVEHRVALNEKCERFSMVNFLDAGPSLVVQAPPELIDDAHPSLFVPFTAGDFRLNFDKIKPLGDIRKGKALDYVRRCRRSIDGLLQ